MIKKCMFITLLLTVSHLFFASTQLETERTVLVPWAIEHTQQWELYEQEDTSISFFRRNEYFEDMQTLIRRDSNWHTLCNLISDKINSPALIFPDLGFAIIDKHNNELLGSIRFKLSSKKGYLSLSYGFKKSARHQKLGYEIASLLPKLINNYLQLPIMCLRQGYTTDRFFTAWYEQGKLNNPDFSLLLDMIEETPLPLEGLSAWVDLANPASLTILMRNGMQPIEMECCKYYTLNPPNLFAFSFFLVYPAQICNQSEKINGIVTNILSRDQARIDESIASLKNLFNIPSDWKYLSLNREGKANLKLAQLTMSTSTTLSDVSVKAIYKYKPPYCFVQ